MKIENFFYIPVLTLISTDTRPARPDTYNPTTLQGYRDEGYKSKLNAQKEGGVMIL